MIKKEIITLEDGREVEAMAPVIVSASRSTDIPAFYADWFMERLKAGYVVWVNPFNQRPSYVSLKKARVIVFWTKDPRRLMRHLPKLDDLGLNYYFQYTLNDYENEHFEPNVPGLQGRIDTFKKLSELLGPQRVIWRFDPLILTQDLKVETLLNKISALSEKLCGLTTKLVFSFVDVKDYLKVRNNLIRTGFYTKENVYSAEPDAEQRLELVKGLAELRDNWKKRGWNFTLATCAEGFDYQAFGIEHNRCIDAELMSSVFSDDTKLMTYLNGFKPAPRQIDIFDSLENQFNLQEDVPTFDYHKLKDKGQREECGCIESKDIGMYNTCAHNCIYCYANTSEEKVASNRKLFLLTSSSLIPFKTTK